MPTALRWAFVVGFVGAAAFNLYAVAVVEPSRTTAVPLLCAGGALLCACWHLHVLNTQEAPHA